MDSDRAEGEFEGLGLRKLEILQIRVAVASG